MLHTELRSTIISEHENADNVSVRCTYYPFFFVLEDSSNLASVPPDEKSRFSLGNSGFLYVRPPGPSKDLSGCSGARYSVINRTGFFVQSHDSSPTEQHATKTYAGVEVNLQAFVTTALNCMLTYDDCVMSRVFPHKCRTTETNFHETSFEHLDTLPTLVRFSFIISSVKVMITWNYSCTP
jgi:hypothetical protein